MPAPINREALQKDGLTLIGLTEQAATTTAKQLKRRVIVVRRESVDIPVRMDYDPGRLRLTVKAGKIASFHIG